MKLKNLFAAMVAMAVLAGCGGGGGSTSTTGGSGGAVSLFATDDMSTAFDHVWINVKQVVLVGAGGDRTIFDDAAGQIFDVKTLRDASGRRFRLLSNHDIPAGQYTGLRVVVDRAVNVFPSGATTATQATFDGAEGATKTFTVNFPAPRPLGRGSDLVVDFDLSRWTLEGTVVTATEGQFLNVVEDNGLHDVSRHNLDDYSGTIGQLTGTAPLQSFTLTRGTSVVTVRTDAATSVFNSSGAASPALTNGERVEVTGVFSTTDNSLTATSIKIEDESGQHGEPEIRGQIASVSAAEKSLNVTILRTGGFVPTTSTLTIQANDSTRYFSDRGVILTADQFFAAAAVSGFVEAEGALSGDVLTATKLKLEDEGEHHGGGGGGHRGNAELSGTASGIDAAAGSFVLSVTRWEGLLLSNGTRVKIATSAETEFKVAGSHSSPSAFFTALAAAAAPNNVISLEGSYDGATQTLTATEVKLGGNGGGGGNGGHGGDDN